MSAHAFALVFFSIAYLAPPAFIVHILWLLVCAASSGKSMALVLQDITVIEEDFSLPHPPGFFDPLQVDLNNSDLDGISCSLSADDRDFDSTYTGSGYLMQDVTADTFDPVSHKTQFQDGPEPWHTTAHADKLTDSPRRSTHKKIKYFFRKPSSAGLSRTVTRVFDKISVPWNRRKERQKRQAQD